MADEIRLEFGRFREKKETQRREYIDEEKEGNDGGKAPVRKKKEEKTD